MDELGFQYGIEAEADDDESQLRFEIAANRYDLLSVEGLTNNLAAYIGTKPVPDYKIRPADKANTMHVKKSVGFLLILPD